MSSHTDTVQQLYQAFGRGDIPAVLAHLAPQVQWDPWADNTAQRMGHPLFAAGTGPQAAAAFFRELAAKAQFHEFQVLHVFGSGGFAAAEVLTDFTYLPTGRRVRDEQLHLWQFDGEGRVAQFRHYIDTAKHLQAAGMLPLGPQG